MEKGKASTSKPFYFSSMANNFLCLLSKLKGSSSNILGILLVISNGLQELDLEI